MFANPTTPNLPDYLLFLRGVAGVATNTFPTSSGTATAGSTTTLTDSTQTWAANQWAGYVLTDVTQSLSAAVLSNTADTLTLATALAAPVAAGDSYIVAPGVFGVSFSIAMEIVNDVLAQGSGQIYTLGVYNLAMDRLVNYAADLPGQTAFADLRKQLNLDTVSTGVASSANDQGTSVGILNPEVMKALTMQDLQTLKTPWGRQYMAFAQMYGPALWGLT